MRKGHGGEEYGKGKRKGKAGCGRRVGGRGRKGRRRAHAVTPMIFSAIQK